jgi:chromosome condensin MukBEF MukE localization factor
VYSNGITAVALSADSRHIAVSALDKHVYLYDFETGALLARMQVAAIVHPRVCVVSCMLVLRGVMSTVLCAHA